jgi:hypothetical protein
MAFMLSSYCDRTLGASPGDENSTPAGQQPAVPGKVKANQAYPPMQYCHDDADPPPTMPYAEGPALGGSDPLFVFWMRLFHDEGVIWISDHEDAEPQDLNGDPVYHRQFPGCPYTGPALKMPGTSSGGIRQVSGWERPSPTSALRRAGLEQSPDDRPVHPEVDTMEFRPSDAKKKDSDRSPYW